jgi:hypothetical protein
MLKGIQRSKGNITGNSRWGSSSPKYDNSYRGNAIKCTQGVDGGAY